MTKFVPKKPEKEVISMRIASEALAEIDRKSSEIGISRNELINQCIIYALSTWIPKNSGRHVPVRQHGVKPNTKARRITPACFLFISTCFYICYQCFEPDLSPIAAQSQMRCIYR